MAHYLVSTNMLGGYLPTGDPIVADTLAEAKAAARQEALHLAEETEDKIDVWAPLRSITKRALMRDGLPVTYAVIGNIEVWIAAVLD